MIWSTPEEEIEIIDEYRKTLINSYSLADSGNVDPQVQREIYLLGRTLRRLEDLRAVNVSSEPIIDINKDDLELLVQACKRLNIDIRFNITAGEGNPEDRQILQTKAVRCAELAELFTKAQADG